MQRRQNDFQRRLAVGISGVIVHRNAAPVVADLDFVVLAQMDRDGVRQSPRRLRPYSCRELPRQGDATPLRPCRRYTYPTAADGLQPLKDFDVLGVVGVFFAGGGRMMTEKDRT